ncbi:hypothetical protein [Ornithinibacillus sp. FSL M8-0202]|uniref:hypothetical protein n=2 Tax=unclassified Ornithinibacillus TaxID=2620869 RepID=UPI0030CE111A
MRQRISFLLITMLCISACSESTGDKLESPYGYYEDDKMIGTVWEVLEDEKSIDVDISEWEKRDRKGPGMTDEGYSYIAKLSNETVIKHEDGKEVSIDNLKKGQKVLVNPPRGDSFEGYPDEIILLEMSYEEKFWQLRLHTDGFNIVVMYETLPTELQETFFEDIMDIMEDKEQDAVVNWVYYEENYVVDYKEEFDIEQFPVLFVFDKQELIFKSYSVDELYEFLKDLN